MRPAVARKVHLSLAFVVAAFAVASFVHALGEPNKGALVQVMWGAMYVALGCFLLLRQAPATVAWLIVGIGIPAIAPSGDNEVHDLGYRVGASLFVAFGCFSALLGYLFPTGRPMPGWWRWPVVALISSTAILVVGQGAGVSVEGASGALSVVTGAIVVVYGVTAALAVPAIIVRFVRSTGQERAQLKWFAFALVLAVLFWFLPVVAVVAPLPPLIAIVVAMTKHHLYDIDRIVSRTASYLIVSSVVLGLYALIVTAMGNLLPTSSTLAVAVATLAAAAAARPLLRKVQAVVDRRFNRSRFDAQRTLDEFGDGMRHFADPDHVVEQLLATVGRSLQPASMIVTHTRAEQR